MEISIKINDKKMPSRHIRLERDKNDLHIWIRMEAIDDVIIIDFEELKRAMGLLMLEEDDGECSA